VSYKFVTIVLFLLCTYDLSAQSFDAKQQFKQKCAMCHGADGKHASTIGKNLGSPDLTSEKVQKMSDKELHETIEKGRGKMPAYGKSLGDKNVDAMVKYVRALK
jgi:cytochrome c6